MIYTCSHKNYNSDLYRTVAISGNKGGDVNYSGESFTSLAPKKDFWEEWHNNIGILSEEENMKYYIEQYYLRVLSNFNPEIIYKYLDNSILLCYEDSFEFCHRHVVAAWFELLLGIKIPEVKVNGEVIEECERESCIKDYLEEIMKKHINMRGFKTLRALYLYKTRDCLIQLADLRDEQIGRLFGEYRQVNCEYEKTKRFHI